MSADGADAGVTAVIFDLDGTLVDSAPDLQTAANRMLGAHGLAPLDLAQVIAFIGNGVPTLVARCLDHAGFEGDAVARAEALEAFRAFYSEAPATLTRVLPGVEDLLARLDRAGLRLGICTNKPLAPAEAMLEQLGLGAAFEVVIGGDSLAVIKPDPAPLLAAISALGATPETTLYVGDSEVDAETAQAAGVRFALFAGGYRHKPLEEIPHTLGFEAFEGLELPFLLGARAA
jgi:phosphoglycolate phosphatase